jgi:hypothetical protein
MTTPEDSQPTPPGVYDGRLSGIRAAWPEPELDFGPRPVVDNDRTMRRVRATRAATVTIANAHGRGDIEVRRRWATLAADTAEAALDAAGFDELLAAARLAETYRKALEALVDVATDLDAEEFVETERIAAVIAAAREALR